ncbi:MAG: HIT family protein [Amphiplicatus sp.]
MSAAAPLPAVTATMEKFGHPDGLIAEYRWWAVLLRPKQPTLGALVLAAKAQVSAFSDLPREAFEELSAAVAGIEAALKAFCAYEKINYLMLMMVDPEPHFHVLPRYEGERAFAGFAVADSGWPGPPALDKAAAPSEEQRQAVIARLRALWPHRDRVAGGGADA